MVVAEPLRLQGMAPMCKRHHFHQFFPPAKKMLPVIATSVTGHLFSLDFHEVGRTMLIDLYLNL